MYIYNFSIFILFVICNIAKQSITVTFVFINNNISLFLLYIHRHCCNNNENFIRTNRIYCENFLCRFTFFQSFSLSILLVSWLEKKVFNCHIILGSVLSNSFKYRSLRFPVVHGGCCEHQLQRHVLRRLLLVRGR